MYYTQYEDYFNSYKTRNSENTDNYDYNCGGYALNTFSWYYPYPEDSDEEYDISAYIENGYTKEEIYDIKLEEYVNYMLNDFDGLRVLTSPTDIKKNERLIYFRIFFEKLSEDKETGYYDEIHSDFHYRFFENGKWHEKRGCSELMVCSKEEMEDDWDCGMNCYDSRTIYLALEV